MLMLPLAAFTARNLTEHFSRSFRKFQDLILRIHKYCTPFTVLNISVVSP